MYSANKFKSVPPNDLFNMYNKYTNKLHTNNKYLKYKYVKKLRTNMRSQDRYYKSIRHELVTDGIVGMAVEIPIAIPVAMSVAMPVAMPVVMPVAIWQHYQTEYDSDYESDYEIDDEISFKEWWSDF